MHIANSAICILHIRDIPSGDVSVTVSTKFFGKKNGKDQNLVSCTKKNILFLVSTRNDNISRGCATKTEFPEGRGVIGKIPSMGGGMDIFWNYTLFAALMNTIKKYDMKRYRGSFEPWNRALKNI